MLYTRRTQAYNTILFTYLANEKIILGSFLFCDFTIESSPYCYNNSLLSLCAILCVLMGLQRDVTKIAQTTAGDQRKRSARGETRTSALSNVMAAALGQLRTSAVGLNAWLGVADHQLVTAGYN